MIKFENTEVMNFEGAIRGMRNPMNSWCLSDSGKGCLARMTWGGEERGLKLCVNCSHTYESHCPCTAINGSHFVIGKNDLDLMKRLINAGTDHRKFMRQIIVSVDITAPLYWWKEFDTYRVGVEKNSCSTMHKIHEKEFTLDDFSHEHLILESIDHLEGLIEVLNQVREVYVDFDNLRGNLIECGSKKDVWWQMIQLLPSSYNQKRTVTLNYEVLRNIAGSRENHKLDEWSIGFMEWIDSLPYANVLLRS